MLLFLTLTHHQYGRRDVTCKLAIEGINRQLFTEHFIVLNTKNKNSRKIRTSFRCKLIKKQMKPLEKVPKTQAEGGTAYKINSAM